MTPRYEWGGPGVRPPRTPRDVTALAVGMGVVLAIVVLVAAGSWLLAGAEGARVWLVRALAGELLTGLAAHQAHKLWKGNR